jgi:hypothetical protein
MTKIALGSYSALGRRRATSPAKASLSLVFGSLFSDDRCPHCLYGRTVPVPMQHGEEPSLHAPLDVADPKHGSLVVSEIDRLHKAILSVSIGRVIAGACLGA